MYPPNPPSSLSIHYCHLSSHPLQVCISINDNRPLPNPLLPIETLPNNKIGNIPPRNSIPNLHLSRPIHPLLLPVGVQCSPNKNPLLHVIGYRIFHVDFIDMWFRENELVQWFE